MSSIDHKWLEDFIALARERSFSKAALTRHVTQPQFSRRIRALELWLGADVVNRANVPLTLTDAGELLLPVARNIHTALADLQGRIQGIQRGGGGGGGDWVVLATGRTLSRTWVPLWVQDLRRSMGAPIKLRLITGSINDAVVALEQGHADFMLSYSHPRLQLALDPAAYDCITVAHEELVAVSAPATGSMAGEPMHSLPGTAKEPVPTLRYAPSLALHLILQDMLARDTRSLFMHDVLESDFAESLHEQALNGQGVAWLPRSLVRADLQSGRLVLADPSGTPAPFDVQLFRPRNLRNALAQTVWKASLEIPQQ